MDYETGKWLEIINAKLDKIIHELEAELEDEENDEEDIKKAKQYIKTALKNTPYTKELVIELINEKIIPDRKTTYSDAYIEQSIQLIGEKQTIKLINKV